MFLPSGETLAKPLWHSYVLSPKGNFVLLHLDIIDDRNKLMTQTMINLILSSNYFMFFSDDYLKACSLVCVCV